MSDILIPFALNKLGEQVSVDEVENGLACECICISCKSKMVAKNQGELKQAHFAHLKAGKADLKCDITFENSVFWMSEDILNRGAEGLTILTPRLISLYDNKTPVTDEGLRTIAPQSVEFTPKINEFNWTFTIKVVGEQKSHPMAVRLSFLKASGEQRAYQSNGRLYSTLLVDLSGLYQSWKDIKVGFRESLSFELFHNPLNRKWVFHERSEIVAKKLDEQSQVRLEGMYSEKDISNTLFTRQERENLAKLANEMTTLYRK